MAVPGTDSLAPLLEAGSVAIVGASADPLKIGGRPVEYLRRFGYRGRIVPVNPNRNEVQGIPCLPRLTRADAIDVAIIAAPVPGANEAVHQCLEAGCKAIILFSAGYAELDQAGAHSQRALASAAAAAGAVLLGPNCLGVINAHTRLVASFTTALESIELPCGSFSYLGQSGALGAYWMEKAVSAGLGISKWITTGNEAQVTVAEALAYLAVDPQTRLIGAYIEDIKRPELFRRAAQAAQAAGKTILAIKSGRSATGQRAVCAHTGAQAGDDATYQSLLRDCGIARVATLTEMIDVARLVLSEPPLSKSRRLGVVTVSGGAGALICDAADDVGLSVPELSAADMTRLSEILPKFVRCQNPIDVTGAVVSDTSLMTSVLETLAKSGSCDVIVLFLGLMGSIKEQLLAAVAHVRPLGKPLVLIWMGAPPDARRAVQALGVPLFDEIPPALASLAKAGLLA
jgi:acyl-CoA synthetase (NDP forming)